MRRWIGSGLLVACLLVAACTPSSGHGPAAPVASDVLGAREVVVQAVLRDEALRFVRAYAAAPSDDARALAALSGSPLVRSWAHWLDVQNRSFPGSLSGSAAIGSIGVAAPVSLPTVPGSGAILRDVAVSAAVRFSARPQAGQPFSYARVLDGPIRFIRDPQGAWGVADFVRDGVPLSAAFQPLSGTTFAGSALSVRLDSFVAVPAWQFDLVVRPRSGPVTLRPTDATLLDTGGAAVAVADTVSSSLTDVPEGATREGIVAFAARSDATGLTLRLAFRGAPPLEIPLGKLIQPIAVTASPSASPAPPG